ncbi:helix-turn-helix domain-containing GNAT family N-acetyltransferase [Sneathiella sp. HT1-7]|uniref:bifunctional helix-turn-helix transcriptional regulator/GNAT family N-acetyltransferase n=1 Tax=Sneathiella sp. HT1-7 TaxID=2887192 RepID=UPI001D14F181|nr:helix-turn-helix domain-containing GNAT family N-acetyltransferase [Sneathiella sp. HT1-7]MCC3304217.1 helix-turn-helix domain-containing GNAT family N-acetyltransferase [Sneathiella sp. HT1-7]
MSVSVKHIDAVRKFNRFYTKHVGALNEGLLNSRFSLTEMRVLYELYAGENLTAGDLSKSLSLDPAYLSRLLKKFKSEGLLKTEKSETDGRQRVLTFTQQGRRAFKPFIKASRDEVETILSSLSDATQIRLLAAMNYIASTLDPVDGKSDPVIIRSHRPGDIGWVIHRHAVLYAREYGFDSSFEALVAQVAGEFLTNFDPQFEHCWIAERNDEVLGSVFLVKKTTTTAQLRLLYVEPTARGLGVGRKLIDECIRFANHKHYEKLTLWTNSTLHAAIHLYEEAGFEMVEEEPHHSFGQDLVGQVWDLKL